MKKILFSFSFLVLCLVSRTQNCSQLPSEVEILKLLSEKPVSFDFRKFNEGCNVTDSVKYRLLYLLKWQWSSQEIDKYLNKYLKEKKSWYDIDGKSLKLAKNDTILLKKIHDSLENDVKQERLKYLENNNFYTVPSSLFYACAYLKISSSIDIIKHTLKDTIHYAKDVSKLALARLGDKIYQSELIKKYSYKNSADDSKWIIEYYESAKKLFFISTQNSIYELHKWLDTSKTCLITGNPKSSVKCSFYVLKDLKKSIKNESFQKLVESITESAGNIVDNKFVWFNNVNLIVKCKKWLIENKGKYLIDKKFAPYLK